MTKRQLAAGVLLHAAALIFAVWLGGQVFNALMVIPVWSASLPESVVAATAPVRQFGAGRINFFAVFNPLWVTLLLAASLLLGRGAGRARRRWTLAFAACSAAAAVAVLGWMAPTVGRNMRAIVEGRFTPEAGAALALWVKLNWVRLGLEFCGLVCALRAVASPATTAGEPADESARVRVAEAPSAEALGRA